MTRTHVRTRAQCVCARVCACTHTCSHQTGLVFICSVEQWYYRVDVIVFVRNVAEKTFRRNVLRAKRLLEARSELFLVSQLYLLCTRSVCSLSVIKHLFVNHACYVHQFTNPNTMSRKSLSHLY